MLSTLPPVYSPAAKLVDFPQAAISHAVGLTAQAATERLAAPRDFASRSCAGFAADGHFSPIPAADDFVPLGDISFEVFELPT
jgi:hypothetical protein